MKMKRSKNDVVKSTLGSYLKRRHYTDSEVFRKSEIQLTQTHQQMAVLAAVDKETTRANLFIYSSTTYDMVQVDNQFSRFKTWIGELSPELGCELSPLVCPLFAHLFLELVVSSPRPMATRFFKRHQPVLLLMQEGDKKLLEELANVNSGQDMLVSQSVREFRSSKFQAKLSPDVLVLLQKYLTVHGHMQLLQILDTWFDIEMDLGSRQEEESDCYVTEIVPVAKQRVEFDDKELIHIREAIRLVHENQATPTKLHVHSIQNSVNNVNCAYRFEGTIAVGWDNEVRLFESGVAPRPDPGSSVTLGDDPVPTDTTPPRWTTLRGHSRAVQAVGTAGDTILSVSRDKTMRAWGGEALTCLCVYRGHNYPIWCLDVGPLDAMVATGSRDRTACLWTLDRTFPLRVLAGHTEDVECLQFHPNGQYLATGSTDRSVRLWSLTDAKMVRVFADHRGAVQTLSFSPNGLYLATGGEDKRVRVWDLGESSVLTELKGHTSTIQGLAWSSDSEQLASCSIDGTVRLWDVRKPKDASTGSLPTVYATGCASVLNVYFSRSNSLVAIGTNT